MIINFTFRSEHFDKLKSTNGKGGNCVTDKAVATANYASGVSSLSMFGWWVAYRLQWNGNCRKMGVRTMSEHTTSDVIFIFVIYPHSRKLIFDSCDTYKRHQFQAVWLKFNCNEIVDCTRCDKEILRAAKIVIKRIEFGACVVFSLDESLEKCAFWFQFIRK